MSSLPCDASMLPQRPIGPVDGIERIEDSFRQHALADHPRGAPEARPSSGVCLRAYPPDGRPPSGLRRTGRVRSGGGRAHGLDQKVRPGLPAAVLKAPHGPRGHGHPDLPAVRTADLQLPARVKSVRYVDLHDRQPIALRLRDFRFRAGIWKGIAA